MTWSGPPVAGVRVAARGWLTDCPAVANPAASKVWAALTTAEGLGTWFGDKGATIDLRPGGSAQMRWASGDQADMRIERVEEPTVFGFTWKIMGLPADDPRRTYVELTLEPVGAGTRLTVVESGFAQLPHDAHRKAYDGNTQGWASELGELVEYLNTGGHRGDRRTGLHRPGRPEPARHPGRAGFGWSRHGHRPGRSPADHPAGHRQTPGPAGRGRPGHGRTRRAAPSALPAAFRPDASGATVSGRAGPRLGRPARRVEGPPQPLSSARSRPVSRRHRMSNRTPSRASSEKPLPRPGTTSTVGAEHRQTPAVSARGHTTTPPRTPRNSREIISDQSFTTTFAVDQTPTEAFLGSTRQSNTGMIGCCSGRRVGAYPCDALITGRLGP